MDARRKSAILWGVVGGMAFMVLAQGSIALDVVDLTIGQSLVVAVGVGVVGAAVVYRYEHRVTAWAADRRA